MSKDIKSVIALGLVMCGVILATVIGIVQIANIFTFTSPILMVLVLIGIAVGIAKINKSIDIIEENLKKGRFTDKDDCKEPAAIFKAVTYNVLNILYLCTVLLFASYGYFLNAFFWMIIWIGVNAAWLKHKKLHKLYHSTTKR